MCFPLLIQILKRRVFLVVLWAINKIYCVYIFKHTHTHSSFRRLDAVLWKVRARALYLLQSLIIKKHRKKNFKETIKHCVRLFWLLEYISKRTGKNFRFQL